MGKIWRDTRLTVVVLALVGIFFLKYPLVLVVIMVVGLAYCIYRILKDRPAMR